MTSNRSHECRPLNVAGVLRCTKNDHWWQPISGTAASTQAGAR